MTSSYHHFPGLCVHGHNIQPSYSGKSIGECAWLCLIKPDCVAFEYGVNYNGDRQGTGYCSLQSGTDTTGCDGFQHNYDLYVKKGKGHLEHKCKNNIQ